MPRSRRDKFHGVRLTSEQATRLEALAEQMELSVSALIRIGINALLAGRVRASPSASELCNRE
jgi:hypothetical protein